MLFRNWLAALCSKCLSRSGGPEEVFGRARLASRRLRGRRSQRDQHWTDRPAWVESLEDRTLLAAAFPEFIDPNPNPGNRFGATVVPLSTGNVVITSPRDDAGGTDAGAVYLFNGATGELISTLTGSSPEDRVGNEGVTALSTGNFVVASKFWDNGAVTDAGAVTFGNGITGVSGTVSPSNSLVGARASDRVGGVTNSSGGVVALSTGNYVVASPDWDNSSVTDAGAVTFGSGTVGVTGAVSPSNSLVGTSGSDRVGSFTDDNISFFNGVTALRSGNYVVVSNRWNDGAVADAGAVTFGNGTSGVIGAVSQSNSLVGLSASDELGSGGVTALGNGNYVVASPFWDNGAAFDAGAVTHGNGNTGLSGLVSRDNSLVGTSDLDRVGFPEVTELSNGNYVVSSIHWNNGAATKAGAVTLGNGSTGVNGEVSMGNSLVGTTESDLVGLHGVTALSNGNYVVSSGNWNNGTVTDAGAVTFGNGDTGITGAVSPMNSLVGTSNSDQVGGGSATALTNGNYVVPSSNWNNGAAADAGAVTFGNGVSGIQGPVSEANSLVGSNSSDRVGNARVTPLNNGNYVVQSLLWNNSFGAATFGNGTTGVVGVVSPANSLVGTTASDSVGFTVAALKNGNYVVQTPFWDNGAETDAGAATFGNGTTGVSGLVSESNSLVGGSNSDFVGRNVTALNNGNYVVGSPFWANGGFSDAGALTFGSGTTGVTGMISEINSLVGTRSSDEVGRRSTTALSTGDYIHVSPRWNNDTGAVTFGNGTTGIVGTIDFTNSAIGFSVVLDDVNQTFFAISTNEDGGRVRVGSQLDGFRPHPTVAITRDNVSPTDAGSVVFSVDFSDSVSGVDATDFALAKTGSADGSNTLVLSNAGDADDSTYTITVNNVTGDGTLGLDLIASPGITDAEGSDVNTTPTTDDVYTIDNTAPTVAVNIADASLSDADNVSDVTFTFSEVTTDFTDADVTVVGGTLSAITGSGTDYSATFTADDEFTGTGSVTVTAGSYSDAVGNAGASHADTVAIDTVNPPFVEIDVSGNSQSISNGDASPSTTDGTDFGSSDVLTGLVARTFTVQNSGTGSLMLGANSVSVVGTHAADFFVAQQPATTVGPATNTTFVVMFDPTITGQRNATVSIANDDADENPFTFAIRGNGTLTAGEVSDFEDSFASGDHSAWASSVGAITVDAASALDGDFGMAIDLSSGSRTYVNDGLSFPDPYRARFLFDPNGTTIPDGAHDTIFQAIGDHFAPIPVIHLNLRQQSGTYEIEARYDSPFGQGTTGFHGISDGVNVIEVDWNTDPEISVGLTVNGANVGSLSVTGSDRLIGQRLGSLGLSQSSGSYLFDRFASAVPGTAVTAAFQRGDSSPTNQASLEFDVTFSSDVTNVTADDFDIVTTGTVTANNTVAVSDASDSDASTYTVTVGSVSGNGTLGLAFDAAAIDIVDSNSTAVNLAPTTNETYELDTTSPIPVIAAAQSSPTNAAVLNFTVNFGEAVSNFVVGDLTVGNGSASNFATSDNQTFTFDVAATADGSVTVDINADVATDAAGNNNTAATRIAVESDRTAPVPVVSVVQSSPTNADTLNFTVNFGEAVSNFVVGDLTVGNGSASNFATSDNQTFTFDVSPTADGSVTVDINAAVATDAAGNNNTAATRIAVESDQTAPVPVVSVAQSSPTNAAALNFTVNFGEAVSDFVVSDLTVGNGSASNFATSDNQTFTFDVSPTADGSVTVDINADVATDAAGNNNTAATQVSIESDRTPPTITLDATVNPATLSAAVTATLSKTADEDVTVQLAFSGTATLDVDYSTTGSVIVISQGETTGSITLNVIQDDIVEGNETVLIDIASVAGGGAVESGQQQATIIIPDDDAPIASPTVTWTEAAFEITEDAGASGIITLTRDSSVGESTVRVSLTGGSATAGVDFDDAAIDVTFSDGDVTREVPVLIRADRMVEPDETLSLEVTALSNATVGGSSTAQVTIANDDHMPHIVVGNNGGASPHVRAVDPLTGVEVSRFDGLGGTFSGGVRTAVADFNNDGVNDIAIAAGPGTSPTVRVLDGANGTVLHQFNAYSSSFAGGVYIAAGDINNDGQADIVTGAGKGGGPHIRAFDGATLERIGDFFPFASSLRGGVRVAVGDTNGDGFDDIIASSGPGSVNDVRVFSGEDGSQLLRLAPYSPAWLGGAYVAAGDLNGDDQADIVLGASQGGGPHVKAYSGADGTLLANFFAYNANDRNGIRVAATDVTGDGVADILVNPASGNANVPVGFDSANAFATIDGGFDVASLGRGFYSSAPQQGPAVNTPPEIVNAIGDQSALVDRDFAFTVPSDAFRDRNQDVLTFSAALTSGGALPSWLVFDANTLTFSGRPTSDDVGVLDIEVTADDSVSGTAVDEFQITVRDVASSTTSSRLAVGAGAGHAPRVQVLDTTDGSVVHDFLAYAASFTGGVDVALGDVNGDGVEDIVTGAGPGGGPHVRAYDGVTQTMLHSFFPFDVNFRGGVNVAAADVNGDGTADIIAGAGPGGSPTVRVYDGRDLALLHNFQAYSPSFGGGVDVAAGDVNADGHADIITGARAGGGPHVAVFDGQTAEPSLSFFAYSSQFLGGVNVSSGDTNGDGVSDVITAPATGGGEVRVFDGRDANRLAALNPFGGSYAGGLSIASLNANDNGLDDIVSARQTGAGPHINVTSGLDLSSLDSFFTFEPTYTGDVLVD